MMLQRIVAAAAGRSGKHVLHPALRSWSSASSSNTIASFEAAAAAGSRFTRPPHLAGGLNSAHFNRFIPFPCSTRSLATLPEKQKQPKHLEDFQHEEIVGPTVERDVSATANELRETLDSLLSYNVKLKKALAAVGIAQLFTGLWVMAGHSGSENLYLWFTGLSAGLSLQLAYLLHSTMKPLPFFQKIEERSRMRVLTLSMQTLKAVNNMFSRSNVVARYTVAALVGALAYEGARVTGALPF